MMRDEAAHRSFTQCQPSGQRVRVSAQGHLDLGPLASRNVIKYMPHVYVTKSVVFCDGSLLAEFLSIE